MLTSVRMLVMLVVENKNKLMSGSLLMAHFERTNTSIGNISERVSCENS